MNGSKSRKLRAVAKHISSQDERLDCGTILKRLKVEYKKEVNNLKK